MPAPTPAGGPLLPPARKPERPAEPDDLFFVDDDGFEADVWEVPEHLGPATPYLSSLPQAWEELTATEDGQYLLRHDGFLYVAVPVNAADVISITLGNRS